MQLLHAQQEGMKNIRQSEASHSDENDKKERGTRSGSTTGTCSEFDVCAVYDDDDVPLAAQFVRSCPPLTDPSWAMEELLRINSHVAVWTGSALPNSVWALPGSGHCPFGSTDADFARIR
ncbi:hypothetical protein, conserved [Trypanosoma brucei brucei TREU927]|uniref:Uncharacterized protein n=4 Tax=Trypanozoon TaxID=39700 RepID=Q580M5_TRYB2|nr:hypothetical protein, conserved [Trypanosoma brucei brucei TREU927]AAX79322.1 hypothetical protein, conserved [Trypanosoma brucei]AAZ10450.1 hypothetical protein, conserved [Trypanosoma brucei brucei TREU927]